MPVWLLVGMEKSPTYTPAIQGELQLAKYLEADGSFQILGSSLLHFGSMLASLSLSSTRDHCPYGFTGLPRPFSYVALPAP